MSSGRPLDVADASVVASAGGGRFGAVVFELLELGGSRGGGGRGRGHVHHHVVVAFLLAEQRIADEAPVGTGADHDDEHHDRDNAPGGDTVRLGRYGCRLAGGRRSVSARVFGVAESGRHVEPGRRTAGARSGEHRGRGRVRQATVGRGQATVVVETARATPGSATAAGTAAAAS